MRAADRRRLVGVAAVLACAAASAGPPPMPAAPAPPPQVLIDPNDPDPPEQVAPVQAVPPDPALVARGHRMYKDYCQKCHGVEMVSPGGGFFDLRTFPHDDKARFVNSVTNGKRAMPAWGGVFKAEDIDTLWAYISSYGAPK